MQLLADIQRARKSHDLVPSERVINDIRAIRSAYHLRSIVDEVIRSEGSRCLPVSASASYGFAFPHVYVVRYCALNFRVHLNIVSTIVYTARYIRRMYRHYCVACNNLYTVPCVLVQVQFQLDCLAAVTAQLPTEQSSAPVGGMTPERLRIGANGGIAESLRQRINSLRKLLMIYTCFAPPDTATTVPSACTGISGTKSWVGS